MEILVGILFIILFIIIMVFVFSIAMLTKIIGNKEILLIIVSSFIIGCIGGASFLYPIYEEMPEVMSVVETLGPGNEEIFYMDVSSIKLDTLKNILSNADGVKSFEITGISFNMWKFTEREYNHFNSSIARMSPDYESWSISENGRIDINITKDADTNAALKAFSEWYKVNYGGSILYAEIHAIVVVESSQMQNVKDDLLEENLVPSRSTGPVSDSIEHTKASMMGFNEFTLLSGVFAIFISLIGIYFDALAVYYRRVRRFLDNKVFKK